MTPAEAPAAGCARFVRRRLGQKRGGERAWNPNLAAAQIPLFESLIIQTEREGNKRVVNRTRADPHPVKIKSSQPLRKKESICLTKKKENHWNFNLNPPTLLPVLIPPRISNANPSNNK